MFYEVFFLCIILVYIYFWRKKIPSGKGMLGIKIRIWYLRLVPIGRRAEKLPGHQESSSSGKLCTADLTYLLGCLRHHSSKPSSLGREGRTLSTRRTRSLFSEDPDVIPFHLSLLTIHCTSKLQFLASNTPHFHADFLAVNPFKTVLSTPFSCQKFLLQGAFSPWPENPSSSLWQQGCCPPVGDHLLLALHSGDHIASPTISAHHTNLHGDGYALVMSITGRTALQASTAFTAQIHELFEQCWVRFLTLAPGAI